MFVYVFCSLYKPLFVRPFLGRPGAATPPKRGVNVLLAQVAAGRLLRQRTSRPQIYNTRKQTPLASDFKRHRFHSF